MPGGVQPCVCPQYECQPDIPSPKPPQADVRASLLHRDESSDIREQTKPSELAPPFFPIMSRAWRADQATNHLRLIARQQKESAPPGAHVVTQPECAPAIHAGQMAC